MKIVMTLLVRNEDDILEQNIAFHRDQGVDFFIVTDHKSEDNTPKILQKYQQRGILEIISQNADTYDQHTWVTSMARKAATDYGADWVINNDADEFWVTENSTLKAFLLTVPDDIGLINVNRYDFYYRPFKEASFYEAMLFREAESKWSKCIHRAVKDIEVETGNHFVHSDEVDLKSYPDEHPLKILHYPVRDYDRYLKKVKDVAPDLYNIKGGSAHVGFHWKKIFDLIGQDKFDNYMASITCTKSVITEGMKKKRMVMDDYLYRYMLAKGF